MQLSEKEIEDFIFEDLQNNYGLSLAKKGFTTFHTMLVQRQEIYPMVKWIRQLELGPYGRADIVGYYKAYGSIQIELIELKAVPIQIADFDQICRYKRAIMDYVGKRFDANVRMHLIGRGFESGHYLHNEIAISVSEVTYDLDGIQFETHSGGWFRPAHKEYNFIKSLHNAEAVHGYR
jgi:hypothetical protein